MNALVILRKINSWVYTNFFAPIRLAKRRSDRLALYKIFNIQSISKASLALEHNDPNAPLACSAFVIKYAEHYKGKQPVSLSHQVQSEKLMPLLTAIDLRLYPKHQDYVNAIRKHSGYFLRNANKAKRQGFKMSIFVEAEYATDMIEIIASKRSKFLQLNQSTQTPALETTGFCKEHICSQHWEHLFGVFSNEIHPKLIAYARLRRYGNIVACQDFIGHQRHLNSGVMKFLFIEIVRWLLDSEDSEVSGLDFFGFGTLEFANDGLFFWKKKALFMPWLVEIKAPPLPEGWDPARYLQLNPDVKAAGVDPVSHYLSNGKFEKRFY